MSLVNRGSVDPSQYDKQEAPVRVQVVARADPDSKIRNVKRPISAPDGTYRGEPGDGCHSECRFVQ